MTYRLMAEWATDLVCKKLNKTARCVTAEQALPGSTESRQETNQRSFHYQVLFVILPYIVTVHGLLVCLKRTFRSFNGLRM